MNSLIISKPNDYSTTKVLDWIFSFGYNTSCLSKVNFKKDEISISLNSKSNVPEVKFNDKTFLNSNKWFRKYVKTELGTKEYREYFGDFIFQEMKSFHIALLSALRSSGDSIGQNSQYLDPMNVNKFHVLLAAKNLGIEIPDSLISNSKNDIKKFITKHGQIILKPLSEPLLFVKDGTSYKTLTKLMSIEDLENTNISFPTYFQEYIEKEFEIRSFFLNDEIYSAALFSQKNEKTSVDYRNYDSENPNRIVPYQLNKEIEKKLTKLFHHLGLNTGSVDLIKSTSGNIVFLEINPVGQFGDVFDNCNYQLHYKLAKSLCEHEEAIT